MWVRRGPHVLEFLWARYERICFLGLIRVMFGNAFEFMFLKILKFFLLKFNIVYMF